ncbi:MAG: TMEM165/GDT1 family protein [Promethearchaeota archaeon]
MNLITLITTFGLLFLGELGDKTQLIVFNLSLEHEKSYKVGFGAMLGFAVIVTLGVFFGAVITRFVPISIISILSGIVFILIGILEARGLKRLYYERKLSKSDRNKVGPVDNKVQNTISDDQSKNKISDRLSNLRKNPYLAGFLFIFIMELGDKTQILTITLASIYPHPLEVWLGSFLALISLAWMGVFFGAIIARKVPKFHLKIVSVSIFIIIGVIILITSF